MSWRMRRTGMAGRRQHARSRWPTCRPMPSSGAATGLGAVEKGLIVPALSGAAISMCAIWLAIGVEDGSKLLKAGGFVVADTNLRHRRRGALTVRGGLLVLVCPGRPRLRHCRHRRQTTCGKDSGWIFHQRRRSRPHPDGTGLRRIPGQNRPTAPRIQSTGRRVPHMPALPVWPP